MYFMSTLIERELTVGGPTTTIMVENIQYLFEKAHDKSSIISKYLELWREQSQDFLGFNRPLS